MPSVAEKPAAKTRRHKAQKPWWGDGKPPHERWPGVSIEIPCVYSVSRKRWESPDGRYYFSEEAAELAEDFFPTFLGHYIGDFAGKPFELLDYQRLLVIRPAFGWLNAKTNARRFRIVFLFVPKANGKSPLGSGIGLFLAGCDGEAAAEVYAIASDKDQAKVIHDSSKVFVEESADLSALCDVTRDSIYFRQSRSFLKVISADAPGKHGRRPHGVIIDEFHTQRNRDLYEAMRKSLAKRSQPMMLLLSHAGDDEESVCFEEYQYAKSCIKDPGYDESYLPIIFEASKEEDWTEESVWRKCNPAFGTLINQEIFASECRAAQNEPRKKNDFVRFNLNQWVNQSVSWIPTHWWDSCPATFSEDAVKGLACCAGLDMAQKHDLTAFVLSFREPLPTAHEIEVATETESGAIETKIVSLNYRLHLFPRFWIPKDTMREHERSDRVPYSQWVERGWVIATEGTSIDYDRVFQDIVSIAKRFPMLRQGQIGFDPAFATDIAQRLQTAGFTMVETPQNYRFLSEPSQVFETLIRSGRIVHDGNRCLRWNIENVAIRQDDAGRIRPVKPRKSGKRIDGVVASIMGLGRLMIFDPKPERSYQLFFVG